jgi:hypothetical protein
MPLCQASMARPLPLVACRYGFLPQGPETTDETGRFDDESL